MSGEAKGLELGMDVKCGREGQKSSCEVGVEGEVTEVSGDGFVAGGRNKCIPVVDSVSVTQRGGGGGGKAAELVVENGVGASS